MSGTAGSGNDLITFAGDLRNMVRVSRFESQRQLAGYLNYSHEAIGRALRGQRLPSLALTLAMVRACDGDKDEWERRWCALSRRGKSVPATPAWPPEPLADGADPESAGCDEDPETRHSQKVPLIGKRHIVGRLELRYSPSRHAAWGRFKGTEGLDKIARNNGDVSLVVGVAREGVRPLRLGYRTEYGYDYHWGDIVLTGAGVFYGWVEVRFGDDLVARGETRKMPLT